MAEFTLADILLALAKQDALAFRKLSDERVAPSVPQMRREQNDPRLAWGDDAQLA